jgi:uncharacterized protein YndB with AHSA1/START domain
MTTERKPDFVYVTYIDSTVDKVWNALTDPELTKDYWVRHRNVSDWKVGSRWTHQDYDDASKVDIVGQVLESEPPKRLVVSWASPADEGQPRKTSRVTYQVEQFNDVVRLTVVHDELEPGSPMDDGIRRGWPLVLSGLKTLLERGKPIHIVTRRMDAPPR